MENEKCKLCEKHKKLVNGHLFPKFIRRWIQKNTDQYLKSDLCDEETKLHIKNKCFIAYNSNNKYCKTTKEQDLKKEYLFCQNCDGVILSKIENDFYKQFFKQIIKSKMNIDTHSNIVTKFSASIALRALYGTNIFDTEFQKKIPEELKTLMPEIIKAKNEWKAIIMKEPDNSITYSLYFDYLVNPDPTSFHSGLWYCASYYFTFKNKEAIVIASLCGPLIIIGKLNSAANLDKDDILVIQQKLQSLSVKNEKPVGFYPLVLGSGVLIKEIIDINQYVNVLAKK